MIIDTIAEDGAYVSVPEEMTREDVIDIADTLLTELASMDTITFISDGLPVVVRVDTIVGIRFTERKDMN
jgi:hypothetical protein